MTKPMKRFSKRKLVDSGPLSVPDASYEWRLAYLESGAKFLCGKPRTDKAPPAGSAYGFPLCSHCHQPRPLRQLCITGAFTPPPLGLVLCDRV